MDRRIAFLRLCLSLFLLLLSSGLWAVECVDVFPDSDTGNSALVLDVPTWSTSTNLIETSGSDSFAPGDHYFNSGQLSGQYDLESTGVTARLYFKSLTITGQVDINVNGNPEDLIIVVDGPISIGGSADINAIVYSTGAASVTTNVDFIGSLSSEDSVTIGGGNTISYDSSGIQDADYGTLCVNLPAAVAYWSFDNNVGYVVPDESGNGHDGTLGANNSGQGDEPVGQCGFYLEFDGNDDYVNVPDHSDLDITQELTVAVWIRPEKIPSSGLMTILSKDENYEFHVNSSGRINWWWRNSSNQTREFNSSDTVTINEWVHVAIVYSKSAGTQTIYLDGVASGSTSYSEDLMNNSDDLQIGNDQNFSGRYFQGDIDEVHVFNSALTQTDIQQLMTTSASFCGLDDALASYIFDGESWNGTLGEVSDGSGNGANATAVNGASVLGTTPAISGSPGTCQYGNFDGQNDYLVTENSSSDLQLSGDYSMGVWVNGSPVADQNPWAGIYARTDASGNNNHWNLERDDGNDRLIIWHNNVSWDTGITLTNVSNAWHHIGIIYSGTTVTSYLDGVQVSSATFATAPNTGNGHLNIGVDRTQDANYVWNGLIDELFIFDKAITAGNMTTLYNQTRPCPVTPSCVIDYQDEFSSTQYDNSDGASDWTNQWIEVNDNDSASNGVVRITGGELRIEGWWGWWSTQVEVYRSVDLSNAVSAQLDFDIRENGAESNDNFWVHVYNGSSWTLLDTFTGRLGSTGQSVSYDLTPYLNADTRIRFSGDGNSSNDRFYVDDLVISGNCASGIDHLEISAATTGSTCNSLAVTVRACEDASVPCSTLVSDYAENISLSISTNRGDWADNTVVNSVVNGTADDGAATYQFHDNDNGDGVFDLDYNYADAITITATDSTNSLTTNSSVITFSDNAFVFGWTDSIHTGSSSDATVAVAGRDHALTVSYVKEDPVTGVCGTLTTYAGDKDVFVWFNDSSAYVPDPNAPGLKDEFDDSAVNLPPSEPLNSNLNVRFANGVADLSMTSVDVGKFSISMTDKSGFVNDSGGVVEVTGTSALATVEPFGFSFDVHGTSGSVNCSTSGSRELNAVGASFASGAGGSVYLKAGETFRLVARAVIWESADDLSPLDGYPDSDSNLYDNSCTPSFGNESAPQTVTVGISGMFPSGGVTGQLNGGSSVAINSFTSGVGEVNADYDEVGVVSLSGSLTSDSYLSAGTDTSGSLANLGRFIPSYFTVSNNSPELDDADGWACNFTYQGQPFQLVSDIVLTLTAHEVGGDPTMNYGGEGTGDDYFKLGALDPNNVSVTDNAGMNPTLAIDQAAAIAVISGADNFDGQALITFSNSLFSYQRASDVVNGAGDAAFPANFHWVLDSAELIDVDVHPVTGESPCLTGSSGCEDYTIAGITGTEIRYGRVKVGNNNGSELMPLALPVQIEYWDEVASSGQYSFRVNTEDTCSDDAWVVGDITLSNYQGKLIAGDITTTLGTFSDGEGVINLSAPGAGNEGSVNVMLDVENWLKYNFLGNGNTNPEGVGSFGIYSGREPIFYLRESYR